VISTVAALYVDPRGPYPALVTEWYDEARDARTYAGPWPVVEHPPCGAWGQMSHLHKRDDAWCAAHAIDMVRRFGGVLEHPAWSRIFDAYGLPRPGELPDSHGGRTYALEQVAWGHPCRKPTWLYVVGVDPAVVMRGMRSGGAPTHQIWCSKSSPSHGRNGKLKGAHAGMRRRSPVAFATWLVEIASHARVTHEHAKEK
jgi:hypothetical protein